MSLEAKIQNASARNAELLHVLHGTDSAIPDLEGQKRYIVDLERQAADAAHRLSQLGSRRKRELKEHESYRDSVMKRFAYKIGGKTDKFEARAAKEEREYFDVLQEEHQADVIKKNLDAMLEDARTVRGDLEQKVATHMQAQKDLDGLYESIFTGPSPGFPEEDDREREMNEAVQAYHEAQSRAEAEGQVMGILSRAQALLNRALISMEDALHASRRDMFGGGTFSDMMERNALSRAENEIQQARGLVMLARQSSPFVRDLPPTTIAQGNLLGDVFFDNIFTDMAFHQKIQQSNLEVQRCAQALDADLGAARQRHLEISRETDQKGAAMREARMRLQKAREAAFDRIADGAETAATAAGVPPPEEPPPGYSATSGPEDQWWET